MMVEELLCGSELPNVFLKKSRWLELKYSAGWATLLVLSFSRVRRSDLSSIVW